MTTLSKNDQHIKELFKEALLELLQERRELFSEIFAEAIEDAGLVNAINEGKASYKVSKKEVMDTLGE
jgi:hypothetical protein